VPNRDFFYTLVTWLSIKLSRIVLPFRHASFPIAEMSHSCRILQFLPGIVFTTFRLRSPVGEALVKKPLFLTCCSLLFSAAVCVSVGNRPFSGSDSTSLSHPRRRSLSVIKCSPFPKERLCCRVLPGPVLRVSALPEEPRRLSIGNLPILNF